MRFVSILFLSLAAIVLVPSCKSKKKASMAGEDSVEVSDFIDFFPEKEPTFRLADSVLLKKDKDSLLINYKVFTQFIPDSLLRKLFGKNAKPKIYPLGRVQGDQTYLFSKAVSGEKRVALILAFDDDEKYIDGMTALQIDQSPSTQQTMSFDKGYSLTRTTVRKNKDGSISEGKDVYGFSANTRKFMLIMTDALDDKITELINPIDTFSRKMKYTGDYGSGKMNLVSIRDGRRKDRVQFFIHFEKNNGECTGELKGEAVMRTATTAEYRLSGDPCSLRFTFSASSVSLKELAGCGAHRGLRCSFDGSYPRKKAKKPAGKKNPSK